MRHLSLPARLLRPVLHLARRLSADNRGNVLMIMGFAIVPMIFAVGFGIDYSRAMKLQTQINAAADAATLSVVSATAMQQSQGSLSNAQFQAQLIAQMEANFAAQTGNLTGLSGSIAYGSGTTVTLTGTLNNGRTAVLNWTAQSKNVFAGILGASTLTISGTSSAGATGAPYINFYLMLDNSPSMLLPSTSAGLSAIATATSATTNAPYGCEFACHEQNPNGGKPYVYNGSTSIFLLSNYYSSGTTTNYYKVNTSTGAVYNSSGSQLSGYLYCSSSGGVYQATRCGSGWGGTQASSSNQVAGYWADGYWLTHNYTILFPSGSTVNLRIDDERSAAQALIPFAQTTAKNNSVAYQMQVFKFDWTHTYNSQTTPVTALTSAMADVKNMTASQIPDLWAAQDFWYSNNWPTSSYSNGDQGSEFLNMLTYMNNLMPAPGDGSTASSPQQVLFLVTDGMSDEAVSGSRTVSPLNASDLAVCSTIKSRGIKIAILYTQYLPDSLDGDSWSQSVVAKYLPAPSNYTSTTAGTTDQVATALQSCASTGGNGSALFYQVATDQSISTALNALFALTVQSAHLVQ